MPGAAGRPRRHVAARRPAAAVLHLLPPGAGARGARGADAAHLGGLSTPEVARAFLAGETAMQQRLVRAKRKIREARHPLRTCRPTTSCPTGCAPCSRCSTWSSTRATSPPATTPSCAASCATRRSGWPALLAELMPDEREVRGLLALMLLHHSRRDARVGRAAASWCCSRTRTARAGTPTRSREGLRLAGARAARRPVRAPGGDRRRARAPTPPTGRGGRALRAARRARALARGRAQPRRGGGDGGGTRGRAGADRAARGRPRWRATTCCTPPRADLLRRLGRERGGGRRLPPRRRAHGQPAERAFLERRLAELSA